MAFFPCSNHHAPYRGPSAAAYPAIVDGQSSNRRHLRMCQPCFGDYLDTISARLEEVDFEGGGNDQGDSSARVCAFCGAARDERQIFVTAYPPKAKERAFFGCCCLDCEPAAIAEVLLS